MAEERSPVTFLPDDLFVDVLARLPARSLCTCTSVTRSWHRLITDPANRHMLAQTLSGLYFTHPRVLAGPPFFFAGVSSPTPPLVDPSFSFLPTSYKDIELLDSCNGLFLFRCSLTPRFDLEPQLSPRSYVVCNPTTEEWVALPQPNNAPGMSSYTDDPVSNTETTSAALGFDPAVSSHFHVFQLVEKEEQYNLILDAIEIYSSETGRWVLSKFQLDGRNWILVTNSMTYFNGFLHLTIHNDGIASVDTKGQTWKVTIVVSDRRHYNVSSNCVVGHSQGRLFYVDDVIHDDSLTIYVLEDGDKEWILKQRVTKLHLFGPNNSRHRWNFSVAAFHPDGDTIIFCDEPRRISYPMI